jgi:hypothetical protein
MAKTSHLPACIAATLGTILLYGTMDAVSAIGLKRCHDIGGVSGSSGSCTSGSSCTITVTYPGGRTETKSECIDTLRATQPGTKLFEEFATRRDKSPTIKQPPGGQTR